MTRSKLNIIIAVIIISVTSAIGLMWVGQAIGQTLTHDRHIQIIHNGKVRYAITLPKINWKWINIRVDHITNSDPRRRRVTVVFEFATRRVPNSPMDYNLPE